MTTNADMTVYHRSVDPETRQDIYARYLVYGVLWEERKAANVIESGLEDADAVTVYAPIDAMEGVLIDRGDMIARGIVEKEVSLDYPMARLQREYSCALVTSVDRKDFGSPALQHYEIGGK